jgi:hypothetical protein
MLNRVAKNTYVIAALKVVGIAIAMQTLIVTTPGIV